MPRRSKGARLYWRRTRRDKSGRITHYGAWVIRDGKKQVSTGCGEDDRGGAEKALETYLGKKWRPERYSEDSAVYIADVLSLYGQERAPETAGAVTAGSAIINLNEFWKGREVADVKRSSCLAYVKCRTAQPVRHAKTSKKMVTQSTARRELSVLSAAIGYWHAEHPLPNLPKVWMPPEPAPRTDFLTRSQAAALLGAALGFYQDDDGNLKRRGVSQRANRNHVARFILIGIYSGTRHGAILKLRWVPSPHEGWADIARGVIHRRGTHERETKKRRPPVRIQKRLLAHMKRWHHLDSEKKITYIVHHGGEPIIGKIRPGWEGARRDAGLPSNIVPHVMRHTCATWLMQAGVNIWEAAGYAGMSAEMLERVYGHQHPDYQTAAAGALSGPRR